MVKHKRIDLVRRALPKSMLLLGHDAEPALHRFVSVASWAMPSEATLLSYAQHFREFVRATGLDLWLRPRYEVVVDCVTLEEACLRLATDPEAAVIARRMSSLPSQAKLDLASHVLRDANTRLLRFRYDVVPLHRPDYNGELLVRRPTWVLVRKLPYQPRVSVHRLSRACWRFLRLADGSRSLRTALDMSGAGDPPASSSESGISEGILETLYALVGAHVISFGPRIE
jgi:hypothetical protein